MLLAQCNGTLANERTVQSGPTQSSHRTSMLFVAGRLPAEWRRGCGDRRIALLPRWNWGRRLVGDDTQNPFAADGAHYVVVFLAVLHHVVYATDAWKWYGVDPFRRWVFAFCAAINAIADSGSVFGIRSSASSPRKNHSVSSIRLERRWYRGRAEAGAD